MTKITHTPGNWITWNDGQKFTVLTPGADQQLIASVPGLDDQSNANATLIAAAPALLEFCETLLKDCEAEKASPLTPYQDKWLRKVIEKATAFMPLADIPF